MIKNFYTKHRPAFKWFFIAFTIKLFLFLLFAFNFIQNWPAKWVTNYIFITSGDTSGYYNPVEAFVNGYGYNSFCRMPGLLPIYAPLYFLFGSAWGKTFVIILQFLLSTLSVYLLARTAELIFNSRRIFYVTFFLYAFSSFVSIWDHYGYSDSFSTSFLIFSFYQFVSFLHNKKINLLLWSGFFLTWSVFFRPANLMIVGLYLFIMLVWQIKEFPRYIKHAILFVLPLLIAISLWTWYNYSKYRKIIVLQGSFSECYGAALAEDHLAIRDLIIGWGGDFQEWSTGSETEWFFTKHADHKLKNPFTPSHFVSAYNIDSLIYLKTNYDSVRANVSLPPETDKEVRRKTIEAAKRFHDAYVSEHPFKYYFLNRLTFIRRFMFPGRLDDLPFPKLSEMSLYHKVIKGGYLVLLNFVTLTGFMGMLFSFSRKNIFQIIPLALVIVLAGVLGFVEQRYLVLAYPFFCIYSSYTLVWLYRKFKKEPA